jgi:hypothetical protein
MPVIVYGNVGNVEDGRGISTTGGFVYRGSAIPELQGHYVFGDWSQSFAEPGGKLFVATETATTAWDFVLDRQLEHFVLALGEDARRRALPLDQREQRAAGRYRARLADRGRD